MHGETNGGAKQRGTRVTDLSSSTPRPGREATTARILDAAEGLFAERGPSRVSMREIALRAGVSHALVHRYLGSKGSVLRAVIQRSQGETLADREVTWDLLTLAEGLVRDNTGRRRAQLRLMTHTILDGVPFPAGQTFPAMREFVRLAALREKDGPGRPWCPGVDPRALTAACAAFVMGWAVADHWLLRASGLETMDREDAVTALVRVIDTLLLACLPWGDDRQPTIAQQRLLDQRADSAAPHGPPEPSLRGGTPADFRRIPGGERRGGRDAVRAATVEAAEELFASRGPADVTMRQIAAKAGVSHALVHRYFGSKADVFTTVVLQHEERILAAASAATCVQEAAVLMLHEALLYRRRYLRLVVRAVLDGLPFESARGAFPATRLLAEMAHNQALTATGDAPFPGVPPRVAVSAAVALMLGWVANEDWLLKVFGLEDWSADGLEDALTRVVACLLTATVPLPPDDAER